MDIKMFEGGIADGLFTDIDVCVRGPVNLDYSGGLHIEKGAKLFDISSLTKALVYLLMWKLFSQKVLHPEDEFQKYVSVPNLGDRRLWHFMAYLVQNYAFDYRRLRNGEIQGCKATLLTQGFDQWDKVFRYDNYASIFVGGLLESYFGAGIEEVLHTQLVCDPSLKSSLLFNPVYRGLVGSELVVPTKHEESLRGLVYDPLALAHQGENLASAGLFSTATTIAELFHCNLDRIIKSGFYAIGEVDQLKKVGIADHQWALGFDIPSSQSLEGCDVDGPLVFAGWTGCRIFFAKRPRITIALTTNRAFYGGDSPDSRKSFSQFFWKVVHEALRCT